MFGLTIDLSKQKQHICESVVRIEIHWFRIF